MIRINLLPHREIRRAEKQREFGLMAVLVAVCAASVLFLGWTLIKAKIQAQENRNARLTTEIARLDKEIVAISGLKEQIQHVLERKHIVENLQRDRNQAVTVLDELARQLPEGLTLKSIKQLGDEIELRGVADNNAQIAVLVHHLGQSHFMKMPNLVEIKANDSQPNAALSGLRSLEFVLKVTLKHEASERAEQGLSPPAATSPSPGASRQG